MDLLFNKSLSEGYKSGRQIARVLTEDWLTRNMYCPICGETSICKAEPNAPVKDYICEHCKSQYELKTQNSTSDIFPKSIADSAYTTMISRITSMDNPNFFLCTMIDLRLITLSLYPNAFLPLI